MKRQPGYLYDAGSPVFYFVEYTRIHTDKNRCTEIIKSQMSNDKIQMNQRNDKKGKKENNVFLFLFWIFFDLTFI